jgi:hypothetical protein
MAMWWQQVYPVCTCFSAKIQNSGMRSATLLKAQNSLSWMTGAWWQLRLSLLALPVQKYTY